MNHNELMAMAISEAQKARCITYSNPWVGCAIVASNGDIFTGSTYEIDGMHAEAVALSKAKEKANGATVYLTLEPCAHFGKTPPCADALIAAGVKKVFIAIKDPDERVNGKGIAQLQEAGIEVELGLCGKEVSIQLEPYLYQRRTKRPFVILKMAMTLDGNIADTKGESKYLTSELALRDVHRLRAESNAILVGANTVRNDDPHLNVRNWQDEAGRSQELSPKRYVLGDVHTDAKVNPCETFSGDINKLLDQMGSQGVLQLLVEGGANVAKQFNEQGLVNEYHFYIAPKLLGSKGLGVFGDEPSNTFDQLKQCSIKLVERVGPDIKIVFRKND